jgi:hypothetical protein
MSDRSSVVVDEGAVPGRLALLTALSLAASALPLPVVPGKVVARIRGAIAQDVAGRHGLSLTSEARRILAEPTAESPLRLVASRVLSLLGRTFAKGLAPVSALLTASAALECYALGLLFERYVTQHRARGQVRVHDDEARELRAMIQAALLRAWSPGLRAEPIALLPGAEDLRDDFTRWLDTALLAGASAPSYVERRLVAAFDAVVAERRPGASERAR